MKKVLFTICAQLFFVPSPIGAAEIAIMGNTFLSFNLNIKINIDADFKYIGKISNL